MVAPVSGALKADAGMLDGKTKGIPSATGALALGDVGRQGWNVLAENLPLPLAVLRRSAIEHNSAWMRRLLARNDAQIAPHGKTTMAPKLFRRQLEDGAWAITVATAFQIRVCRDHGINRIILANQLVGAGDIAFVLDELARDPGFDFYCLVDSPEGVARLADAARKAAIGRPLQVLLEIGYPGGRTGCRSRDGALSLARAIKAASPHLALRGVEGFEGLINGATPADAAAGVRAFLDEMVAVAVAAAGEDLFAPGPIILTAGGSAFYDLVLARFRQSGLARETRVVIRSGCYLTHDSLSYRQHFANLRARTPGVDDLGEGPQAALEVWAHVQSRPDPDKAILAMGRRDVGTDGGNPVALKWFRPGLHNAPVEIPDGHVLTGLNDQHSHMALPAGSPLAFGDLVAFGVSHPCTTFDKWRVLYLVDDAYNVIDAVETYF
jgi:D-serine dehydratase